MGKMLPVFFGHAYGISLWCSVSYIILGLERTFSFLFLNFPSKLWLLSMVCAGDNTEYFPKQAVQYHKRLQPLFGQL